MANGLYANTELVETIIVDLNNVVKEQLSGQYVQACFLISQIAKKLVNLRKGIEADINNKNEIIEQLKEQLRNAGVGVEDMTPEEFVDKFGKEGANNGG